MEPIEPMVGSMPWSRRNDQIFWPLCFGCWKITPQSAHLPEVPEACQKSSNTLFSIVFRACSIQGFLSVCFILRVETYHDIHDASRSMYRILLATWVWSPSSQRTEDVFDKGLPERWEHLSLMKRTSSWPQGGS